MDSNPNADTNTEPRYRHPPQSPADISPADEVYRDGDEVLIVHGPGDETRVEAEAFYDESVDTDTTA